jgi:hypothetical protein
VEYHVQFPSLIGFNAKKKVPAYQFYLRASSETTSNFLFHTNSSPRDCSAWSLVIFVTMNISQPVPSAIGSVDFGFLTEEEVENLSVKQIQNPTTFDTLLHPVPGGLYDLALGAWGDAS